MLSSRMEDIADKKVLYLTTIGCRTGLPREIEIWFIVFGGRFYLFAETGEAAKWVKNIRSNPNVVVGSQIGALMRRRACSTAIPTANCGIVLPPLLSANTAGVTDCRSRYRPPRVINDWPSHRLITCRRKGMMEEVLLLVSLTLAYPGTDRMLQRISAAGCRRRAR